MVSVGCSSAGARLAIQKPDTIDQPSPSSPPKPPPTAPLPPAEPAAGWNCAANLAANSCAALI